MALTYDDSSKLMNDATFRGRVKVSALKFATSIMDEPGEIPAHNTRMKWAQQCYGSPDQTANQITPPVVMDSAVQESGSGITDTNLQGAVEAVVNKMM